MHSGDVNSGHYTAFIKPTTEAGWLKFDDDRVIPVTKKEAILDNYGGGEKGIQRFSSAYMLVYFREYDIDMILCDVQNAPGHLGT